MLRIYHSVRVRRYINKNTLFFLTKQLANYRRQIHLFNLLNARKLYRGEEVFEMNVPPLLYSPRHLLLFPYSRFLVFFFLSCLINLFKLSMEHIQFLYQNLRIFLLNIYSVFQLWSKTSDIDLLSNLIKMQEIICKLTPFFETFVTCFQNLKV